VGTVVISDASGCCVTLGEIDGSIEYGHKTWIDEVGPHVVPTALHERLTQDSVALATAAKWSGVGRVRWALTPKGDAFILGFSGRLTTGYDLVEAVHGVDLIHAQHTIYEGVKLDWDQASAERCGIQVRLFHVDPDTGTRPNGMLETLDLPVDSDVVASAGVEVGTACSADSEPLLAKLTAVGDTRTQAIASLKAALDATRIEGVANNLQVLRGIVASQTFADRSYDVTTFGRALTGK
jgi:acetyl/propionyl-CoA carboxylase alpha subunit